MANKNFTNPKAQQMHELLTLVYGALKERGYDASAQLTGYLAYHDEDYITPYNKARTRIQEVERDDLIKHLVRYYFDEQL